MQRTGQAVTVENVESIDKIEDKYGIPTSLRSCHTAIADGYIFEGHVPLDLVLKVLKERPPIAGLAVPGMPPGPPGMEVQGRNEPYRVIAFDKEGKQNVFAER